MEFQLGYGLVLMVRTFQNVEGKLKKNPEMASYFGTAWAVIGMTRTMSTPRAAAATINKWEDASSHASDG